MSDYVEGKTRWWGWGNLDKTFDLEERAYLLPYLREKLDFEPGQLRFTDPKLEEFLLPEPKIPPEMILRLEKMLGEDGVSTSPFHRISHSMGKSYRDLLRWRMRRLGHPVDAVAWPREESEVAEILRLAQENQVMVIPFGGGSSVTGGLEPLGSESYNGTISIDLARMNRVIKVDATSCLAVVQAGIQGPELEESLNAQGFTLGHFPESFHHSSLGGWIVTRSAGRQSTGYGKIEDMVLALRMVTPQGLIATRKVPHTAAGPSLLHLIMGSEGTLGIVTEATMRVRPYPEIFDYHGLIFRNFAAGVSAIREILQTNTRPACIRLSDRSETALAQAVRSTGGNKLKRRAEDLFLKLLASRGYSFEDGAFMILGFEGERDRVEEQKLTALGICKKLGGFHLGTSPGKQWYHSRYDMPYFRDMLLNWGVMVDTLETATTWDNLLHLYGEVRRAIKKAIEEGGKSGIVACHVSHSYREGASLYYTFLAPMEEGKELEQWERVKRAATDTIWESGGTITHHHGVGYEHVPWMEREVGLEGLRALRALKETLDPKNIMNPGKLLPK
jgi:alkyldihydroxyacetonephosphate synthase